MEGQKMKGRKYGRMEDRELKYKRMEDRAGQNYGNMEERRKKVLKN